jgi:hypothetical protein
MPTIDITNNTDAILSASSADDNATLNRYLKSVLNFKTFPPLSIAGITALLVKDQSATDFPIILSATGEGKFAVEQTTLDVQIGAGASIGLLQGDDEASFFATLKATAPAASSGLVSFALTGTLTAADSGTTGDVTFGITEGATVSLTGYYAAGAGDKLVDAVKAAAASLTIPNDIADLRSIPAGAVCGLAASSSLKFSASFTYSFLNDPLATLPLGSLPSFDINASVSSTIEGSVTHTSGHTLTIASVPGGHLHISVCLTKTDDFETSLTVSAGATAQIGSQDALAFLLGLISPNSADQADAIAKQMPDAGHFKADIKSAIDTALSSSLAVSLKGSLDRSKSNNRVFLFDVDLSALDGDGAKALLAGLRGDFTALTATEARFAGIELLDSALTVTTAATHTMALHFLGIFNAVNVNTFVAASKIDFTADTHELVLSDETVTVVDNNLDAEKLRQLVIKDMTLTLPASANTKDVAAPITLAFIDREGSTSYSKMHQFVNVLNHLGAPGAAAATALFNRGLDSYGVCGLSLGLSLNPAQCRSLFIGPDGPYDYHAYIAALCAAEQTILRGDPYDNSPARFRLFSADQKAWDDLAEAGAPENIALVLRDLGFDNASQALLVTDVITAVWWATAMADYAKALAKGQSLEGVGAEVVKDANLGYNEPWMVLAAWDLAGRPATVTARFFTSLPAVAGAATV